MILHPKLGNDFADQLSHDRKSRTTELSETTIPTAFVTALMLAAAMRRLPSPSGTSTCAATSVEVAARGRHNSFAAYHEPTVRLRQFLDGSAELSAEALCFR
jgi:hypothetical protein